MEWAELGVAIPITLYKRTRASPIYEPLAPFGRVRIPLGLLGGVATTAFCACRSSRAVCRWAAGNHDRSTLPARIAVRAGLGAAQAHWSHQCIRSRRQRHRTEPSRGLWRR